MRPGSKDDVLVQINYIVPVNVGVEVFKKVNYTVYGTGISTITRYNLGELEPGDEIFVSALEELKVTIEQLQDAEKYEEFLKGATPEQIRIEIELLEDTINESQKKLMASLIESYEPACAFLEIMELDEMLCKFQSRLAACKNMLNTKFREENRNG